MFCALQRIKNGDNNKTKTPSLRKREKKKNFLIVGIIGKKKKKIGRHTPLLLFTPADGYTAWAHAQP